MVSPVLCLVSDHANRMSNHTEHHRLFPVTANPRTVSVYCISSDVNSSHELHVILCPPASQASTPLGILATQVLVTERFHSHYRVIPFPLSECLHAGMEIFLIISKALCFIVLSLPDLNNLWTLKYATHTKSVRQLRRLVCIPEVGILICA